MTVFSMVLMGIEQLWSNPFLIFQTFLFWLERAEFCWDIFNLSFWESGLLAPSAPSLGYMKKKNCK